MYEALSLLHDKDDVSSQAFVEYRPVASKNSMPCSHCKSAPGEDTTKTALNLPLLHSGIFPARIAFHLPQCPKLSAALTHTNLKIGLTLSTREMWRLCRLTASEEPLSGGHCAGTCCMRCLARAGPFRCCHNCCTCTSRDDGKQESAHGSTVCRLQRVDSRLIFGKLGLISPRPPDIHSHLGKLP